MPLKAIFRGKLYPVDSWSTETIDIAEVEPDAGFEPGKVLGIRLLFPFETYQLVVNLDCEVRQMDEKRHRAGLRVVDQTPRQLHVLRYVADAMKSGEIVDAGDVLEVTARPPEAPSAVPKVVPQSFGGRLKQAGTKGLAYVLLLVAGVTVISLGGTYAYDRLFTVEARSGAISGDLVVLAAPVPGQLKVVTSGDTVGQGAPAFEVAEGPDSNITVPSPCDCRILKLAASDGTYVRPGQAIVTLAPRSSRQYVSALVDPSVLMHLSGASARLEYVDGTVIDAAPVKRMLPSLGSQGLASTELVSVEIDPGRQLAIDTIGEPVAVRFDTFGKSWIGRTIAAGRTTIAGLFGASSTQAADITEQATALNGARN